MFRKYFKYTLVLVVGLIIGVVYMSTELKFDSAQSLQSMDIHMNYPEKIHIGYPELVSIALTAATVALGSVALVVGVAAIFGYKAIRDGAIDHADKVVNDRLNEVLDTKVDSAIVERLQPRLDEMLKKAGTGGALDKALARTVYGTIDEELADDASAENSQ